MNPEEFYTTTSALPDKDQQRQALRALQDDPEKANRFFNWLGLANGGNIPKATYAPTRKESSDEYAKSIYAGNRYVPPQHQKFDKSVRDLESSIEALGWYATTVDDPVTQRAALEQLHGVMSHEPSNRGPEVAHSWDFDPRSIYNYHDPSKRAKSLSFLMKTFPSLPDEQCRNEALACFTEKNVAHLLRAENRQWLAATENPEVFSSRLPNEPGAYCIPHGDARFLNLLGLRTRLDLATDAAKWQYEPGTQSEDRQSAVDDLLRTFTGEVSQTAGKPREIHNGPHANVNLRSKHLTTLPSKIGGFGISSLDVSGNQLTTLPESLMMSPKDITIKGLQSNALPIEANVPNEMRIQNADLATRKMLALGLPSVQSQEFFDAVRGMENTEQQQRILQESAELQEWMGLEKEKAFARKKAPSQLTPPQQDALQWVRDAAFLDGRGRRSVLDVQQRAQKRLETDEKAFGAPRQIVTRQERPMPEASSSALRPVVAPDKSVQKWNTYLQNAMTQNALTLRSQADVDLLNNVPVQSWNTDDIEKIKSLTINGYDLRGVSDLGERLGAFSGLKKLDLQRCKIDAMDISALPETLEKIDLQESVVPLPLQERLQETFRENVALTPRTGQIKHYEKGMLGEWVGHAEGDENRQDAARGILKHLKRPTPSLAITDKNIRRFDDDFPAMIASNDLRDLDFSGNKLGIGGQNMERLALNPNLTYVDLSNNQFTRVPDGIEHAPGASTIDLTDNPLSPFAKLDAELVRFARVSGLRQTLDARRREQHGPTIKTDDHITSDKGSISSRAWLPHAMDDVRSQSASVQEVEAELAKLRVEASSRADELGLKDLETHERLWDDIGHAFERQAYVSAMESVIANQGGPFKSGRMQKYYQSAELGATIACNRSLALHQLPGQPDVTPGTAPGLKTPKYAAKTAGGLGKLIPAFGGPVEGAAQVVGMGIDLESERRFNAFHDKLTNAFRPGELQELSRVLPLAMTLTMGEQLESQPSVHEGKTRHSDPAQSVIDWLQRAVVKDTARPEEKRAFRDVAYLMADIASGAAYGAPGDEGALQAKLHGMTFEQKVEGALRYWADKKNAAEEKLPFKSRYILCDSPVHEQLATLAKNYTLGALEQGKQIRRQGEEIQGLRGQLESERTKRHEVKRSSRATTQSLIDMGIALVPPSPWASETDLDKQWWAERFPPEDSQSPLQESADQQYFREHEPTRSNIKQGRI